MVKNLIAGLAVSTAFAGMALAGPADEITMHLEHVAISNDAFATIDHLPIGNFVQLGDEPTPELPGADVIIDQIFNIGQKIWDVIKANQPVVNIKYNYANALPRGIRSSEDLDGFSELQSEGVRLWGTNGFGSTVYDITLAAVHQYNGSYDGKGKYLETVSVVPTAVSVLWGYTVDINVSNVSQVNLGSKTAPVAGLTMETTFAVSTVIKKSQKRIIYSFRGDSAKVKTIGL